MMVQTSALDLRVLQTLRLKSMADLDTIAAVCGGEVDGVADELERLEAEGLVRCGPGDRSEWMLTPAGRAEGVRRLAAELDAFGARAVVGDAYERFRALNGAFLNVCTDWQRRDVDAQIVNDHRDDTHDAAVIGRLARLHEQVLPICDDLAAVLPRFGRYAPGFTAAMTAILAGDHAWFTEPLIDSYHTLWFELHEDLLSTLGIERSQEVR